MSRTQQAPGDDSDALTVPFADFSINRRLRVLTVLSSSNQMYSGIGRAVFEIADRLRDRVEYEFAIDDHDARNVGLVHEFAKSRGMTVHVGRWMKRNESLDTGNKDLANLLRQRRWDVVECVCWANSDTNATVLDEIGSTALVYTPHEQPSWTVPSNRDQERRTEAIHSEMIRRADLVLCDSPWERDSIRRRTNPRENARYLPLGCDFGAFEAGGANRKPQLLFVGDFAEPRKRFDRVISLMESLLATWPDLRLVMIGNRSENASEQLPESIRHACEPLGYATEDVLRQAYRESLGLVLLSDFEAFGIPILESLASGTPVFLSDIPPTRSVFGDCAGAHFCPAGDAQATHEVVDQVLRQRNDAILEALADRSRLQSRFDWSHLSEEKWRMMQSILADRYRWAS